MIISYTKFWLLIVALIVCCLAYYSFALPANENKRILSINSCGSVKECPEGEEAYFRTYPDVEKTWNETAYYHWETFGKAEGKHYVCMCPKSEDKAVSEPIKNKNNDFVVVAIFKNEAMVFAEWISHYLWQGASHFYLIDNGSTDGYLPTVPKEVLARINITRAKNHQQIAAYNSLLPMLLEKHPQDWALVVDFDEFVHAKPPETIASYLSTVSDDIGQVSIPWRNFGSSGHVRQPKSVRCSFVQRGYIIDYHQFKSVARISSFERIGVHCHRLLPGFQKYEERDRLQLNHYRLQSEEYFRKIKMTRGDVNKLKRDHHRDWNYFLDFNERMSKVKDRELCLILGCCVSQINFIPRSEKKLKL